MTVSVVDGDLTLAIDFPPAMLGGASKRTILGGASGASWAIIARGTRWFQCIKPTAHHRCKTHEDLKVQPWAQASALISNTRVRLVVPAVAPARQ